MKFKVGYGENIMIRYGCVYILIVVKGLCFYLDFFVGIMFIWEFNKIDGKEGFLFI